MAFRDLGGRFRTDKESVHFSPQPLLLLYSTSIADLGGLRCAFQIFSKHLLRMTEEHFDTSSVLARRPAYGGYIDEGATAFLMAEYKYMVVFIFIFTGQPRFSQESSACVALRTPLAQHAA